MRNPKKRKVTVRDVAVLYGLRPKHDAVWHLSPYEFVSYWEPVLVSYPLRMADVRNPKHHVRLTDAGTEKLRAHGRQWENLEMVPGYDYEVKEGGDEWMPFPDVPSCQHLRHTWVLQRRRRPKAPCFSARRCFEAVPD